MTKTRNLADFITTGVVDGRDVGTDGTKLDSIELGATGDQSASEIKAEYESNTNTNAFTDAEKAKLLGIAANADVTDASKVSNAGAVMVTDTNARVFSFIVDEDDLISDSDQKLPTQQSVKAYVDTKLQNIEPNATADQTGAEIKAAYEAETNTNAYTDAEKTKLSGIESNADITDAANVEPLVDAHLNTSTANTGEYLSWNGSDYDWATVAAGYSNSDVDTHLNTSTATNGQLLSWDGSDYDWADVDLSGLAPLASPAFTGTPTAPTAPTNTNTTQVATTAYVMSESAYAQSVAQAQYTVLATIVDQKLPKSGGTMTGNIVFNTTQTFDGRDLSVDGSKLDGIEAGATADQTDAEIKTAYENNADTNAFTNAEKTKLSGIETNATADQTGAEIKVAYEAEANTNAFTDAEKTKLSNIEANATADQTSSEIKTAYESNADTNAFTDAEQTKLAGIEANADVTDTANVTAAGALMDNEVTNLADVKSFDPADYATAAQGATADAALPKSGGTLTGDLFGTNATLSGYLRGPSTFHIDPAAHGDDTGTLVIRGNLTVQGTSTSVHSENVSIADSIFILNSNATGLATEDAGVEIERGDDANVRFIWDETNDRWDTGGQNISVASVIVSGTVDGRDVAADGTKLDGIEAGATADQTKADIDALNIDAGSVGGLQATQFLRSDTGDTINVGRGDVYIENNSSDNQNGAGLTIRSSSNPTAGSEGIEGSIFSVRSSGSASRLWVGQSETTTGLNDFVTNNAEINGNITITGLIDGRDVSADGTKLDGIEAGATADQTGAEIKTAYEAQADTNAFTDAEKVKLSGIEANADVTDTANVQASGALMDSEITNLDQVKSFNSSDYATAAQGVKADTAVQDNDSPTFTGLTVSGNVSVSGGTVKLDGNYPSGTSNSGLGSGALGSISTGALNVGIGANTLTSCTSGSRNSAVGVNALYSNLTGHNNTAIGFESLYSNTSGGLNSAVGRYSLYENTTGNFNCAFGDGSMRENTEGGSNTSVGSYSLHKNTTGQSNAALGRGALYNNITGFNNSAVGRNVLYNCTGYGNTAIGYGSGQNITTGNLNTIIGRYSGNQNGLDIRTTNNNIVLSDGGGNPRLYYTSGDATWFSGEIRDKTTASSSNVFIDPTSGYLGRSTSSKRYKKNIKDAQHGLSELLSLRPVTYKGKNDGEKVYGGLIAEEVHEAGLSEFVEYNKEGKPDSLAYGHMVSLCIKAIQEQQSIINDLKQELSDLRSQIKP